MVEKRNIKPVAGLDEWVYKYRLGPHVVYRRGRQYIVAKNKDIIELKQQGLIDG